MKRTSPDCGEHTWGAWRTLTGAKVRRCATCSARQVILSGRIHKTVTTLDSGEPDE
jgi:hypothetical protein